MRSMFTKRIGWALAACFLIAVPVGVMAQSVQTITIPADEIIDGNFIRTANAISIAGTVQGDVIVAGSTVTINGAVEGDVIAAGNTVVVNGSVGGSVFAAGNSVEVNGSVAGSVRLAGSNVVINNSVERNVWAMGSTVTLREDANVGWDVVAMGAAIQQRGTVAGNVWATGENITIDGQVQKNIDASLDQTGQLVLGATAVVDGDVIYRSATQDHFIQSEGATVVGEITHEQPQPHKTTQDFDNAITSAFLFFKVVAFFGLLAVGLVIFSLAPKSLVRVYDVMKNRPAPSIGWGVVFLLLTPILIIIFFVTLIGIPLALITLLWYFLSIYVAKVFAGFAIGLWIANQLSSDKKYKKSLLWPLVGGVAVLVLLTSIPIIGWLFGLLITLWSVGALLQFKRESLQEYK